MKKPAAIATLLLLALAACDDNTRPATTTAATTAPPSADAANTANTVAAYLAAFGLSEADFKPSGHASSRLRSTGDKIIYNLSEAPTPAQKKAWVQKVFAKAKSLSDNGKIYEWGYYYYADDETKEYNTALSDAQYEADPIISIAFPRHKGKMAFEFQCHATPKDAYQISIKQK